MKIILKTLSYLALFAVIAPPILYLASRIDKGTMSTIMLIGTILWFTTVPFWMGRKPSS